MPLARSADRLRRILVLVPWVMANKGCSVDDVCARFGMTRDELSGDLELLFMCGLPPFGPGDLMEAYIDGDEVVIRFADYLAKPPRLTRTEAIGLLVMGRALLNMPGLEEADSLRRALDKLSDAISPRDAQSATDAAGRIDVELSTTGTERLGDVRRAIDDRARLRIAYYSAGRAEMSEREIDPLLAFNAQGYWYVVAYDHASSEQRLFRIDRIRDITATGETFGPRTPMAIRPGLFTPSPRDLHVEIEITPGASWIREVVPIEEGSTRTRLHIRTPHLAWLVRLLLSAGPAARAVSPPELVDAVTDAARRALLPYGEGKPTRADKPAKRERPGKSRGPATATTRAQRPRPAKERPARSKRLPPPEA
ncbi:MAG: helix-turn-helix transcriptional regulator [Actinomycetota bacterium]